MKMYWKYKRIFYNHARKQARLKIRFKIKRKRRNRLFLGLNRERRISKALDIRFKDYKKIKAPKRFSLTENTEESLYFISKLEDCLEKHKRVFVNLTEVEQIAHGAIVVLLSIMIKFKSNGIDFNGNFPTNRTAYDKLLASGFFKELYKKKIELESTYEVSRNRILTHANKIVDTRLTDSIVSEISTLIWGEARRCTGVQRVFIELMQNTNNHASIDQKGNHHWWTTVEYDPNKNIAYFSFLDYGIGIIKSLRNDTRGKFYNIIPNIIKLFNPNNNADMLMLLLKGEIHRTSTGRYYRGKGLPCLFKTCDDNKISNVVVIANDAKVEYATMKGTGLRIPFNGTFIHWELNAENLSLNY